MPHPQDDDWKQLRSHLEALRMAGLTELPIGQWAPPPRQEQPDESPVRSESVRPATEQAAPKPPAAPPAERAPEPKRPSKSTEAKPRSAPPPRPVPAVGAMFDQSRIPIESPVIPIDQRPEALSVLAEEVAACTLCPHLAATRTQTVFQSGSPAARLMFIGEAPGADEDRLGEPFVGRAGQLLTDIISKGMGLSRSDVYIANILKCRPPENRNPLPDEMANCRGYLERQIEIVRPEFICLLGKVAVGAILETSLPMKSLRQRWFRFRNIPTIVTWHPAYLLRNPAAKKDTWDDVKLLMAEMGLKPPGKV
jgi:DNA polymerase